MEPEIPHAASVQPGGGAGPSPWPGRVAAGRVVLCIIVSALAVEFCAWAILTVRGAPDPGFFLSPFCQVSVVQPRGPAARAGLRVGDRILSIDGTDVSNLYDALPLTTALHAGSTVRLVVQRKNRVFVSTIRLAKQALPFWAVVSLAGYLFLMIMGFFLYLERKQDPGFSLFLWLVPLTMVWSITRLLVHDFYFAPFASLKSLGRAFEVSFLAIPVAVHFFYVVVVKRPVAWIGKKPFLALMYGPVVAIVVAQLASPLLYQRMPTDGSAASPFAEMFALAPLKSVLTLTAVIWSGVLLILCVALLIRSHVHSVSAEHRSQIKLVFFSVAFVCIAQVVRYVAAFLISQQGLASLNPVHYYLLMIVLGIGPVFLLLMSALAMIRFRMSRVDSLIRRTVIHGLIVGTFLLLYLALIEVAALCFGGAAGESGPRVFFLLALFLVILFEPVKSRFQRLVERLFYREKGAFQRAFERLVNEVSRTVDLEELRRSIVRIVVGEAKLDRGFFLAPHARETAWAVAGMAGAGEEDARGLSRVLSGSVCEALARLQEPVSRHGQGRAGAGAGRDEGPLLPLVEAADLEVLVPLVENGRSLGVLGLGRKLCRRMYTPEEMGLLRQMAGQCAGFIRNALRQQELEALQENLRRQAEITEKQKEEIRALRRSLSTEALLQVKDRQFSCPPVEIIGKSAAFRKLMDEVREIAPTNALVLVLGETGTGKDLVARAIHLASRRKEGPFVYLNCSAIPEGLLESELYGHEKGAFTGAVERRAGKFELASGGTLFLNEIGDMPLSMQVKLLRAIEYGEVERVGGTRTVQVDVRFIAATNKDLEAAVEQGTFRRDLYYRLKVVPVRVPPLRERAGDVPLLARHFLARFAARMNKQIRDPERDLLEQLAAYHWPGNVREMENLIERAVVLAGSDRITLPDPGRGGGGDGGESGPAESLQDALNAFKREFVLNALRDARWNKTQAARRLGLQRSNLYRVMEQLGIGDEGDHV